MSIITVIAKSPMRSSVLFKLHKLLKAPLADTKSRVESGAPIFEEEIFDGSYDEKSKLLRDLIAVAQEEKINLEIFETPANLKSDGYKKSGTIISQDTLKNILDSADEDIDRF